MTKSNINQSVLAIVLVLSAWSTSSYSLPRGCFPQVQNAANDLRHAVVQLGMTSNRYEPNGQTVLATQGAGRQVGAFEYMLSRSCNVQDVLRGRDQVRDALDKVRQAFRASPVLSQRPDAFNDFRRMVEKWELMRDLISDLGNMPTGQFFQAVGQDCRNFCQSMGRTSSVSPEGAQCVSGENRPASAIGHVNFVHGCWKTCEPHYQITTQSVGRFCYKPGQKRDNDRTDITVGCFCQ